MSFFRENQFKNIDDLLTEGNHVEACRQISSWQHAYLALFQEQFPQHKEKLILSDFAVFWQQRRESLRLSGYPDFRFQAQVGLDDADFVTGYIFYLLALKGKKDNQVKLYNGYLSQAIAHNSFHAIQKLLHDLETDNTDKNEGYCIRLVEKLQQLDESINQHGSPGYLLLANGYLHVALQAKRIEDAQAMSAAAFSCVWKYLNLAKFATENSTATTHNAYFGLDLAHSNPFNLPSIDSMLDECRGLAGDALPLTTQKLIKNQTRYDYNKLQEAKNSYVLGIGRA